MNKEIENSVRFVSVFVDEIHPRRFALSLLLLAEKARKVLFTTQFCCAWTTFYHLLFLFRIVARLLLSIFPPAHHPMLMFSSACESFTENFTSPYDVIKAIQRKPLKNNGKRALRDAC